MQIAASDKFVKVIDFLRRQLHRETLVGFNVRFNLSLEMQVCFMLFFYSYFSVAEFLYLFFCQFVYVNGAFSPNPDELVLDLYNVSCCSHDISWNMGGSSVNWHSYTRQINLCISHTVYN